MANYKKAVIDSIRVSLTNQQRIVVLKQTSDDRYLPIWIGAAEATAIAYAQQGVVPPRPLTHDLLRNVIDELGHTLTRVRIVALKDGVFHAVLDLVPPGAFSVGQVPLIDAIANQGENHTPAPTLNSPPNSHIPKPKWVRCRLELLCHSRPQVPNQTVKPNEVIISSGKNR